MNGDDMVYELYSLIDNYIVDFHNRITNVTSFAEQVDIHVQTHADWRPKLLNLLEGTVGPERLNILIELLKEVP